MNLLIITVDDMNWSLPGFMGGGNNLTPNLDKLAARSHRFVSTRTVAPICQPSREAILTGRVPQRSGGLGFTPVHAGVPTLTSILKEHHYYSVCIHKVEHMQPYASFPWDETVGTIDRNPPAYSDAVTEAILHAREAARPFFICCNDNDPHRPFYGSQDAEEIDNHDMYTYKVPHELIANDVQLPPILDNLPDVRKEFAQYCNSVQRADRTIGKVVAALEVAPERENTVVLFVGDHGMPFPFSKATCYNDGTRTPALLYWPQIGPPQTFTGLTSNIDILPTLLDLLQIKAPEGIDGWSWMPLIEGKLYKKRDYVVTNVNSVYSCTEYPQRAIHDDRYMLLFAPWADGKLRLKVDAMGGLTYKAMVEAAKTNPQIAERVQLYTYGTTWSFYDLVDDPGQRNNLIDAQESAVRIEKMKKQLLAYMKETEDPQLDNLQAVLEGRKPVVKQPNNIRTEPVL